MALFSRRSDYLITSLNSLVLHRQRPSILGHKVEAKIADLCQKNTTLLKFGIFLEIPGSRLRVLEYIQRNNDTGVWLEVSLVDMGMFQCYTRYSPFSYVNF